MGTIYGDYPWQSSVAVTIYATAATSAFGVTRG